MRTEFALAWRLLARQWRSGELHLMITAAVLAIAVATMLAAFGDRLERALVHRAADMLGADLVLTGSRPPTSAVLAVARAHGLASAQAVDFNTMLTTVNTTVNTTINTIAPIPDDKVAEKVLLVAVRAADAHYPLRGELRIGISPDEVRARTGPLPGTVWIEPRVRDELGVAIGARVGVGYTTLQVVALIAHEPDRAGDFAALSPRVLMNSADLAAARVIQPGSRVRYRTLFAGGDAAVAATRAQLETLRAANEELVDVRTGSRRTASALSRTMQFLSLAGIFGVILCGAAIGIAADRQARRLYDTVALLRTFGLASTAVWRVLALEVLLLTLVASIAGTALGYAAQALLAQLLAGLLPDNLPAPGFAPLATGIATACVALPAFTLPSLARLAAVSPLRVLRRDFDPPSGRTLLHYAFALSLLAVLLLATATDRPLAATMLGSLLALIIVAIPLAAGLLRLLHRLRPWLALPLRLAADRLAHAPWRFGAQLIAFALILGTMTITSLLRDDLFASWQRQLPADAPNLFAINLLPHERDAFVAALTARGIATPPLYPVTPGRLVRAGDAAIALRAPAGSDTARALDRDIILTQSTGDAPAGSVSVEEKLAQKLALKIGETLTFVVEGREITVRVAGFRPVDWDSFQPNFYMVFSPGTLAAAPYTWLTSFHATDPAATTRALRAQFPALTLIEVGPLLARMNAFVGNLAGGIEFVLALLLLAALLLLVACVITSLDERLVETAVLRVLGARRQLVRNTLLAEFALLGFVAGLLAMVITEIARWQLYTRIMELDWTPLPLLWLLVPLASAALLAITGMLAARRSMAVDAATILNAG